MAGGGNNMLDMGLMIAAGIAAPELAPVLMEGGAFGAGLGATEATALTGATLSGLTGAATGQDPAKAALMGGLGGAAAGYFGGVNAAEPGSMLAAGPTTPGAGLNTLGAGVNPTAGLSNINAPTPTDYANFTGQPITSAPPPVSPPSIAPQAANAANIFDKANMIGGGVAGINALLSTPPVGAYTPPGAIYTGGSLSKFKYDPNTYQPDVVRPPNPIYQARYAEGGIASLPTGGTVEQMSRENAMGGNTMFPQSGIGGLTGANTYQNATNTPMGSNVIEPTDAITDPYTGQMKFANGGIAQLAVGGKLLKGDGDGMSDGIRANIDGRQEARLADGEFVVPADVVSHLGNGSTDAGAKQLYSMMDRVRQARVGNKKQGKQINPAKYMTA
jgi:hypothetical protein